MKSSDMAEYMRLRREKRRNNLIELKGGCCEDCGSTDNLEFNHIDRETKSITLSGKGLDGKWELILDELDKCELLCREHHLERTRAQYANGEIVSHNSNRHLPYIHGTMRMYNEDGCRCDNCRYAKSLYRNKEIRYSEIVSIPR